MRHCLYIALVLVFCHDIRAQKQALLPDTITLCAGDSASIQVDPRGEARTRWITPAGPIENTRSIKAFAEGRIFVFVNFSSGMPALRDSSYVRVLKRPLPVLSDTTICAGTKLVLDAGNAGMKYLWKNGERGRTITVSAAGKYWVKVSNGRCHIVDTLRVEVKGILDPLKEKEKIFCLAEPRKIIVANAGANGRVEWQTGPLSPTLAVSSEGTYRLRLRSEGCEDVIDSIQVKFRACGCEVIVPNSFTPNEDNRNDHFLPVFSCEYSYYNLLISDRWGNPVFQSRDPEFAWDGRYKGNLCPEDIYLYTLETTEKVSEKKDVRKGYISLFR